jgi:prophage regulatory protein
MSEIYFTDLQLAARYGVHRTTPWRWAQNDPSFPKPLNLSPGCTQWKLSDVEAWEARKKATHAS